MQKNVNPNHVNSHWSDRPGKWTATGIRLRAIVQRAYGVESYQIKGPEWLTSERYDITAQWPPETPKEQFPLMLQSFLKERFKLSLHHEQKVLPVYELRIAKTGSKLQAVGEGHSSMDSSNGHWSAQHMSMPAFVALLSNQISRPVLDKTGLSGFFNFELQFTPENEPSETNSTDTGPSIFTAVEQQLGLKLVPEKSPVDILFIDHLEKVPTDN